MRKIIVGVMISGIIIRNLKIKSDKYSSSKVKKPPFPCFAR